MDERWRWWSSASCVMRYLELPKLHQRYMCEARHAAPLLLVFHMFMFPFPYFCFKFTVFKVPVPKSWVAQDEDRGVAPSPGFTSLFMSQPAPACFTRGREGVLCSSTQLTTQKFYVRLLCFYKTHFTSSRSIWPIPSFTGHQLHRSLQTGRFSNGTKKFQHTNPLKSCVCSGTPFYQTLVPSDPKW